MPGNGRSEGQNRTPSCLPTTATHTDSHSHSFCPQIYGQARFRRSSCAIGQDFASEGLIVSVTVVNVLDTHDHKRAADCSSQLELTVINQITASMATAISLQCSCFLAVQVGTNTFPPLNWGGLPAATKEVLLVIQDPDAPLPSPIVHSILYGIPPIITSVSEKDVPDGSMHVAKFTSPKSFKAGASFNKTVWMGPKPVIAHGVHRYFSQVGMGAALAAGCLQH